MRRLALVLLVLPLGAVEIGQPAPALTGAGWLCGEPPGSAPAAIVLSATWCAAARNLPEALAGLQLRCEERVQIALLLADDARTATEVARRQDDAPVLRLATAPPTLVQAWLGESPALPQAVLIDGDGLVAWCGHPLGLEAAIADLLAGTLDRVRIRRSAALERDLEQLVAGDAPDLERVLTLTGEILALEPLHPLALDVRLAAADRCGRDDLFRSTLEAVPLARLGAWQACDLAAARLDDPTPGRRHLDLALAWLARARALAPDDPQVLAIWARALAAIGLMDEALAAAEAAQNAAPRDATLAAEADELRETRSLRAAYAPAR